MLLQMIEMKGKLERQMIACFEDPGQRYKDLYVVFLGVDPYESPCPTQNKR